MNTTILILVIIGTMVLEIKLVDPYFWNRGKSDKPASTIIAGLVMIVIGIAVQFVLQWNWALSAIFLAFALRVALFDYLFVIIHNRRWNYLGLNRSDNWKDGLGIMRYGLEGFVAVVGVMQYLYFDCSIYCDRYFAILFDLPKFLN